MELLIKNGFVYDPINGIDGERVDIAIKDGRIVERVDERRAEIIDASGMIVMPGGVDLHSHIVGGKVNSGRLLRPEDHRKDYEVKTKVTRSGVGYSIPSTFTTGYRYSRMGYTTVMDPAIAPLKARHAHEELNDTPMIDKGFYPLLGDWWFVLEFIRDGKIEECAAHVAWLISSVKGYAIKLVNPGGLEAWGFGRNVDSIDDPVPYFNITPRDIIRGLCKVNQLLNLPHAIHIHTNNLGKPGNYTTTLDTMKCVEDLAIDDKPIAHVTHCQFNAFKGVNWKTLASGAPEIADYVNKHKHVTLDMGQIIFTDTTTMTADGPFQYILYKLTGNKWVNSDVETETSAGIVPIRYRRASYANAVQWSIGLELALLIKDTWKVYLTTDHPNGGPFTEYPRVIAWLMSRIARERTMKRLNKRAVAKMTLPSIDREYTFYEIAIATRAGPARSLGLKNKGHLGVGADADVAIYDVNPKEVNPSRQYKLVRRAFRRAAYTIKSGEVVVKNGEIVKSMMGDTIWCNIHVMPSLAEDVAKGLKKRFREYWTVEYDNYPIPEKYLSISYPMEIKAKV